MVIEFTAQFCYRALVGGNMSVNISYMGTKRQLAPAVASVIKGAQPGILFDAFSGMCTVGEEVGVSRPVWTNDTQLFAAEVGAALFTSQSIPPQAGEISDKLYSEFQTRRQRLGKPALPPQRGKQDDILVLAERLTGERFALGGDGVHWDVVR